MNLIWNWKGVLKYAWSVRLIALAAVLSGIEVALSFTYAEMWGLPPGTFSAAAGVVSAAALLARLVAQGSTQQ